MIKQFPILFDDLYKILSSSLFLPPSKSFIEINGAEVRVQMSWAFRCRFPKKAVQSTEELHKQPLSRGVHGFAGRWLVNGSGKGILTINLMPTQRGYVIGFPIHLKQLMVSVEEPAQLANYLKIPPIPEMEGIYD
jgi:hypothetical protein